MSEQVKTGKLLDLAPDDAAHGHPIEHTEGDEHRNQVGPQEGHQILQGSVAGVLELRQALLEGAKGGRIIKRHLLPNCIGQIVTTTFLQIPAAIFLESFLSFLGVGVSAPQCAA